MNFLLLFISLFIVLLSLPPSSHGWGPLSHSIIACTSVAGTDTSDCVQRGSGGYVSVGAQMPDAFAFGSFTLDPTSAYTCRDLVAVHDLSFAGFMILQANQSSWPFASAFSRAFASHMIADYVGLFPSLGVLSSPYTVAALPGASPVWIPEWGYMADIDARLAIAYGVQITGENGTSALPIVFGPYPAAQPYVAFLAQAIAQYQKLVPSFPLVSEETVSQCAQFWNPTVEYVFSRSAFMRASPEYLGAELLFYHPSSASSEEFDATLNKQLQCIQKAIANYQSTLEQFGDFSFAATQASVYIAQLYALQIC